MPATLPPAEWNPKQSVTIKRDYLGDTGAVFYEMS